MFTTTTTAIAVSNYVFYSEEQSDKEHKRSHDYCKCGGVAVAKTAKLVNCKRDDIRSANLEQH